MASGRLTHIVSSRCWDGPARYALDICRHFRDNGWNVTACTPEALVVDSRFSAVSISLRHLPLQGVYDPASILCLASRLRAEPERGIIHTHNTADAFIALTARKLARRKDLRVILTRHSSGMPLLDRISCRVYRNLDSLIFTSRFSHDIFMKNWDRKGRGKLCERVKILHYALREEESVFLPEPVSGPRTGIWQGRISPGKGLETIIDAIGILRGKRIRMTIAGTGHPDYVDSLRRRAYISGASGLIDWKGKFDNISEILSKAHFGIALGEGDESFGYPNIEYMAAGRPQITTGHEIQREYLTDGKEALFVPSGECEILAETMQRLADDPDLRAEIGQAAFRRNMSDLNWRRFMEEMTAIYEC